jgi:hypothetical protein
MKRKKGLGRLGHSIFRIHPIDIMEMNTGIDPNPVDILEVDAGVESPETFPQLVKKYRPGFSGFYTESAEGALTGIDSTPERVIDLVKEMSKLTPA